MTFEREYRYAVIKLTDAEAALTWYDRHLLDEMLCKVYDHRRLNGKRKFRCVVVESDWPEYEPTWKAIEERMEQEREDNGQFGVGA